MSIIGIEGMTGQQLHEELQRGGKFVIYQYTISVLILTFRRGSDVYFIRGGHNAVTKGLGFSLLTLVAGWWGIPWGPIYTIGSLVTNFGGGKDVTAQVIGLLQQQTPPPMPSVKPV
jgi:hypothetical protein